MDDLGSRNNDGDEDEGERIEDQCAQLPIQRVAKDGTSAMARGKMMRRTMKDEVAADEGGKGTARDELMQLRCMPSATKAASSDPTSGDSQEAKTIENSFAPSKFPKCFFRLYFPTARNSGETQTGASP